MVRFGHGSYSKLKGGLWEIRRGTKDASAGEGTQIYEGKGGKRTCWVRFMVSCLLMDPLLKRYMLTLKKANCRAPIHLDSVVYWLVMISNPID